MLSPKPVAVDSAPDRPSSSSPACACGRLRRATRALTQLYDDLLAPAGLRLTQFSLLRTLAREGPHRISDLAAIQLLDRTALSRNLDPLVEQGLVEIVRGDDARTREVALSRKGAHALHAAEPHWARAQRIVAERIGASKLETLIATLGELEALHPANDPTPGTAATTRRSRGHASSHTRTSTPSRATRRTGARKTSR